MKIICRKYYDEVVRYAESIGDETLQECLDRLEHWEQQPGHPCEIELYRDWAPYSFDFSHLFSPRHCLRKRGTALGLSKTSE